MPNKSILITGISKGIGEAIARDFLERGHQVIGVGRSGNENLEKKDGFVFKQCDLLNTEAVQELAKNLGSEFEIDMFIHNAMYTPPHKPFLRYKADDLQMAHQVATIAPMQIIQRISSSMRKKNFGRIIFLGSLVQETGSIGQLAYLTAKSAMDGLMKGLTLELATSGITSNLILLGAVETEKLKAHVSEEQIEKIKEGVPTKKLVQINEIVEFMNYLLSEGSTAINGQRIPFGHAAQLKAFK